ncbi:hypothetical protein U1Q18_041555 [Sarracenia purpurea var. burkii]
MAALTGRIQRLKGIIPAKLISADLGAPSLSSPLDRVSGEGERSLVNDFPIVKKAGTDSVAFPLVDDKDERTTVTDNNNFGEIGPTMELYAEPSITGKQAEVDMDIPTYAHVVLDKMIEPCLTADRVSDGEDVVIGEMQSSEGEEGERDEVDGPVMDQSEEGPVASESKGEVRGRRVEACKVFENVPQSKTNGPGAGYGHSGFVQNGAGQSWADIVGNREICYPRPLVSESNGARSEMELEFIKCSEDSSAVRALYQAKQGSKPLSKGDVAYFETWLAKYRATSPQSIPLVAKTSKAVAKEKHHSGFRRRRCD